MIHGWPSLELGVKLLPKLALVVASGWARVGWFRSRMAKSNKSVTKRLLSDTRQRNRKNSLP